MPRWLATCPGCGVSAPDLAALQPTQAPYREEADPFLRWAMVASSAGDQAAAAEALLHAAWMADDAGHDARAAEFRGRAAAEWGEPTDLQDALRLIDVLRRAGAFEAAAARADAIGPCDEQSAAIVAFQRGRIAARDAERRMMSSALRPPARRPHVSHVAARPRGLWQRLLGG